MAACVSPAWDSDSRVYEENMLPAANWSYDNFGPDAEDALLCDCFLRTDDGNIFGNLPETDIPGCSRSSGISMYYVVRDDDRVPYLEIVIDVVFDRGPDVRGSRLGRVKATSMLTHDDIQSVNWKEVSFLSDEVSRVPRFRTRNIILTDFSCSQNYPLRDVPFHEQMNGPGTKVIYDQAMFDQLDTWRYYVEWGDLFAFRFNFKDNTIRKGTRFFPLSASYFYPFGNTFLLIQYSVPT
jgi:hypothetical protein